MLSVILVPCIQATLTLVLDITNKLTLLLLQNYYAELYVFLDILHRLLLVTVNQQASKPKKD